MVSSRARAYDHAVTGRRERKKAQTRAAVSDVATRLFLERGFDAVTVKEIAAAADVSPTTVFNHFPTKEALVFDEDPDNEAQLVSAVRDRPAGADVLDALEAHLLEHRLLREEHPGLAQFVAMVEAAPALREYERRMLDRHEQALTAAILEAGEAGMSRVRARALARFVLDGLDLARGEPDRHAALREIMGLLRAGWREPT